MLNQKTKKKKSLNGAGARPSVSPLRSADWTAMRAASRSGTFLATARRARPRDAVRYANGSGSSSPRMRANVQANCCWGSVGGRYSHWRERKEKEKKGWLRVAPLYNRSPSGAGELSTGGCFLRGEVLPSCPHGKSPPCEQEESLNTLPTHE